MSEIPRDAPVQLPALMNTTIGRAREIASLSDALRRADPRLLTLTGPGGVGKTRLALEVARSLSSGFTHHISFVTLAPLVEPEQVLPAIAQALNIESLPGSPLLARVQHSLCSQPHLLILDNFEHLLPAAPLLSDLLASAPLLKVLVTSRERLHLYGEHEIQVQPLALVPPGNVRPPLAGGRLAVDDLQPPGHVRPPLAGGRLGQSTDASPVDARLPEQPAAIQLFLERARAVRPSLDLDEASLRCITEICIHLDGLPLAIELAAARAKLLSPREILERLQNMFSLLTGGARDLPPRQQSLRNTLDWSYELLSPDEQRFFRCLGVLRGSWSLADAASIGSPGDEPGDEEAALTILTSLVDKSLVRIVEMEGEARFMLLETIREYALDCLERHQERADAQHRHARYFTRFARQAARGLHSREQRWSLRRLDSATANLWSALRRLIASGEAEAGSQLAAALVEFVSQRGFLTEGRNWFEELLALPGSTQSSATRARILYGAGLVAARVHHDLERAHQRLREAESLAQQAGDPSTEALALGELALLNLHQGQYETARDSAERGLQALQDHDGQHWCRGVLHNICGIVAGKQCDFKRAQTHYDHALTLLREAGDSMAQAGVLGDLAGLLGLRGKLRTAQSLYQRALTLHQETDDRWNQAACLNGIAGLLRLQGRYDEARQTFDQALTLAISLDHTREQSATHEGLGLLALDLDEQDEARGHLKEALRLARAAAYLPGMALALCSLGDLCCLQRRPVEAEAYYQQCLDLLARMGDRVTMINVLLGQGRLAQQRHDHEQAGALFQQSLNLAWELGARPAFIRTLEAVATLCRESSQPELAAQLLGASDTTRQALGMPRPPAACADYEPAIAQLRSTLPEPAFSEHYATGQALLPERVLHLVDQLQLPEPGDPAATRTPRPVYPAGLTAREMDVLRLLASGLSDAGIAQELVLSPRTINTHLRSIYAKLGVSSRSAATRFAFEHHLADA